MKVLLHICCANCLIYPFRVLKTEGREIRGFFYNPNIHPYQEYKKRKECLKNYAQMIDLPMIWGKDYELEKFIQAVVFREHKRCEICYYLRLEETAKVAKENNFDAFTTTLLYSKYQKFDSIIEIGRSLGEKYNLMFLEKDFREGWKEGIQESKRLGLYRQQYCGCIYSEKERYMRKEAKNGNL